MLPNQKGRSCRRDGGNAQEETGLRSGVRKLKLSQTAGEATVIGASHAHNLIVGNLFAALKSRLSNAVAVVYLPGIRVKTWDRYECPDIVVVSEAVAFVAGRDDMIENPALIAEVLWPPTMERDMGTKFVRYRRIPALREYVLIDSSDVRVESFRRAVDSNDARIWTLSEYRNLDALVSLDSLAQEIPMREIYAGVFSPDVVGRMQSPSSESALYDRENGKNAKGGVS